MNKEFGQDIEAMRRLTRTLKVMNLNLATVVTDKEYAMGGNMFYVIHSPDAESYINVRFNDVSSPQMKLVRMLGLRVPHERVFITTPAGQTGTLTILHGLIDPDLFAIIDNRSATSLAIESLLNELRGDVVNENWGAEVTVGNAAAIIALAANADRKGCCLQAKSTNGGIIYLGFDNTVTTTKWIAELQAGVPFTVDDYRGDIYARADALGQLLGWGEW